MKTSESQANDGVAVGPLTVFVRQGGHQIGGNLVEVTHEDGSTLILDLGLPLFDGAEDRPFPLRVDKLHRDKAGSLAALRAKGVATKGMGIFADEEPRENVAVCVSHAHADHWGLLPLLKPELAVYASTETRGLIEAQCAWRGIQLPALRWTEIRNSLPFKVGCINVESHVVNHSVPGALAFSIEGGTKVVYTGDLRFAGLYEVECLVAKMPRRPDLLLCEGTRLGEVPGGRLGGGEEALLEPLTMALKGADGLVTFACSAPHLGRLATLCAAAKASGRQCAIDLYTAYVLLKAGWSLDGYRVFWTKGYVKRGLRLIQGIGGEEVCEAARVRLLEIEKEPGHWMLALRGGMLADLEHWAANDWAHLPGPALHLHSLWRGYRTMDSSARLEGFLAARGARVMDDGAHASGHASEGDLREFVRRLSPIRTLALHSFHPELLSDKET